METQSTEFRSAADALRRIDPWSAPLNAAADAFLAAARPLQLRRGDELKLSVGIVASGVLAVAAQTADGRQTLCQLIRPGDVLDRRVEGDGRIGEAIALADATLLTFREAEFDDLLRAGDAFALAWSRQLAEQVERQRRHCFDIAFKTPLERLASAVLEFRAWSTAAQRGAEALFELPVQQFELAQYLGVTPETISRSFRQLNDEGVMRVDERGGVTIDDLEALLLISRGGRPRASTRRPERRGQAF